MIYELNEGVDGETARKKICVFDGSAMVMKGALHGLPQS